MIAEPLALDLEGDADRSGERMGMERLARSLAPYLAPEALTQLSNLAGATDDEALTILAYVARAELSAVAGSHDSSSSSLPLATRDDDDDSTQLRARRFVTVAELRERFGTVREALVRGFISVGEVTMIPGPPESLKSWSLADLARAVFTGGKWLAHFEVPQGSVLWVEAERAANLAYQFDKLALAYGVNLDAMRVLPPSGFDLLSPEWLDALETEIKQHTPKLVVFNSWRTIYRGRAADPIDTTRAMQPLGSLAERYACAVVIVDQLNKAGGLGLTRGMQAHSDSLQKEYDADTVLHVERDRDEVGRGVGPARLYVGKSRYGQAGEPFVFELVNCENGGVKVVYAGETTVARREAPKPARAKEKVINALSPTEAQTPEQIASITNLVVGTVKNKLTELQGEGRAVNVERGRWRRSSSSSLTLSVNDDDDEWEEVS